MAKAAQPIEETPAGPTAAQAVGADAVAPVTVLANAIAANGTATNGAAANGGTHGSAANGMLSNGADVDRGAKSAQKRPQEAARFSREVATSAANSMAAAQHAAAEKPRKKSKAEAAAPAASTGAAADDSVQPGLKRKREQQDLVLPADAESARGPVKAETSEATKQPGEKLRKKSKKDSQQARCRTEATPKAEVASSAAVAELVSSKTPKQNGEAGRSKVAEKGSQQQKEGAEHGQDNTAGDSVGTLPKPELRKLRKQCKATQARLSPVYMSGSSGSAYLNPTTDSSQATWYDSNSSNSINHTPTNLTPSHAAVPSLIRNADSKP